MSGARPTPQAYGRLFWVGLAVGWSVIGFGVLSLVSHAGATHPIVSALYVVGAALAHDLVLVPLTLAFATMVGGRLPARIRARATAASIATGVVLLFVYPALRGFGRLSDNPSLLPRDYAFGLAVALAVVWLTAAVWRPAIRLRRRRSATTSTDGSTGTGEAEG